MDEYVTCDRSDHDHTSLEAARVCAQGTPTQELARRERDFRRGTFLGRLLAHGEPCLATEKYAPGELARRIARSKAASK